MNRVSGDNKKPRAKTGFTIIELLIATFVIGTALIGVFGMFLLSLRLAQESERRLVAIALANERMENVRNLPYVDVGTSGGVPSGSILQQETVVRNNVPYTVDIDIRYVDDIFDGEGSGIGGGCIAVAHVPAGQSENCQDLCVGSSAVNAHIEHGDSLGDCAGGSSGVDVLNTDYKQVRVEVSWPSPNSPKPILLITKVAPQGVEGGELFGTLSLTVLDALGAVVPTVDVGLVNNSLDPVVNISTQTDSWGGLVLPGLPEASQSYELTVSKTGYTSEQTYDITADFVPDADHNHLSMLIGEVTDKTIVIDLDSRLTMTFEEGGDDVANYCEGVPPREISGQEHTLRGTKTIGVDGSGDPVYIYDFSGVSDASGQSVHENLVWDTYDLALPVTTVCDIKETSLVMPVVIGTGQDLDMTIKLVKHTPISLHVTVIDPAGLPIDNTTVRLVDNGVDETLGTGIWGQVLFEDIPTNDDYTLEVNAPGYVAYSQTVTVQDSSKVVVGLTAI